METNNITEQKILFRKEIKKKRSEVKPNKLAFCSHEICKYLFDFISDKSFNFVLSYIPLINEIDTTDLHDLLKTESREVYIPKTDLELHFYEWSDNKELLEGAFHCMEPNPLFAKALPIESSMQYLIVLPGLSFNKKGQRIGYGKGYYDRFLDNLSKQNISFTTVGVCMSQLEYDSIPCDENDYKIDYLCDETGLYKTLV